MAEVTINEIRSVVDDALTGVRMLATDAKNAAQDARNAIIMFSRNNSTNNIEATLSDIRSMVQEIRSHGSRITEAHTHAQNTERNLATVQQHLLRIDSNTSGAVTINSTMQQLQAGFNELNQRIANMEQFMGDLGMVLQDLNNQLVALQQAPAQPAPQQQAQQQ